MKNPEKVSSLGADFLQIAKENLEKIRNADTSNIKEARVKIALANATTQAINAVVRVATHNEEYGHQPKNSDSGIKKVA